MMKNKGKTLRDKFNEFMGGFYEQPDYYTVFEAGVAFDQEWTPVEQELPETSTDEKIIPVICKWYNHNTDSVCMAIMCIMEDLPYGKNPKMEKYWFEIDSVGSTQKLSEYSIPPTHWRLIERKIR